MSGREKVENVEKVPASRKMYRKVATKKRKFLIKLTTAVCFLQKNKVLVSCKRLALVDDNLILFNMYITVYLFQIQNIDIGQKCFFVMFFFNA